MYLMKNNIPVFAFDLDKGLFQELRSELMPIRLRNYFRPDESRTAFIHNYEGMIDFLSRRVLSLDRKNAKKILNAYNLTQSQSPVDRAKIAITCRAVSMIDDYWISDRLDRKWEEMDPKINSLSETVTQIALHGTSLTLQGEPHTPDITGQGSYAKSWIREKDGVFLYKKSTEGKNESGIEVSVSNILDCFNIPHVQYLSAEHGGDRMCKCLNMTTDRLSIVYAEDYFSFCNRRGEDFLKNSLALDGANIYKMCIVDYLISNSDRHMQNWGFYMNNRTGNLICCHPVYDHNNAFDRSLMADAGESQVFLGQSKKDVAAKAMKQSPLCQIKPIEKSLFLSGEHYESFMERASDIGIFSRKKRLFRGLQYLPAKMEEPVNFSVKTQLLLDADDAENRKIDFGS